MVKRFQDWPTKLAKTLKKMEGRSFRYGTYDCFLGMGECVKSMTGEDPTKVHRGSYHNKLEAYTRIRELGGLRNILLTECAKFGWKQIHPSKAQRGDILLIKDEKVGELVSVVSLDNRCAVVIPTTGGVDHIPLEKCDVIMAIRVE